MYRIKRSKLLLKDMATSAIKNNKEKICMGFFSFSVIFGKKCENNMPRIRGIPSRIKTVSKVCHKSMCSVCSAVPALLLRYRVYSPP